MLKLVWVLLVLVSSLADSWGEDFREIQTLGSWDFAYTRSGTPDQNAAWGMVEVPHTWNAVDATVAKHYERGVGRYRTTLTIPAGWSTEGRSFFLRVGAASTRSEVLINGAKVAEHHNGFTAFVVPLAGFLGRGRAADVLVKVDNSPSDAHAPIQADYAFCGGIYRPVTLISTNEVHISLTDHASSGVYLTQRSVSSSSAWIDAGIIVANDGAAPATVAVQVAVFDADGHELSVETSERFEVDPRGKQSVVVPVEVRNPRLWNGRADPYLHHVRVRVLRGESVVDEVVESLGLRSFTVDAQRGFLLNGQPYDLHGPSLHQDHLGKGWAISEADHRTDAMLLHELGATFVRLVHYPHAPVMIDHLDRLGIVAWSEIPFAYFSGKNPAFDENCRTMLTEMIHQLYNHPSICFWGMFNEISSLRPEALELARELSKLAREIDPGRPTVGSIGAHDQDPVADAVDLPAYNRYFGWFIPGVGLMEPWAEAAHKLFPARRIGLAEYGAEGDVARHADHRTQLFDGMPGLNPVMGTEEYQTQLHEELWLQIKDKAYLWCKTPWCLADWARGGPRPISPFRGDGIGKYGFVTSDRQIKKDVFYWYKANWSKDPVLHIAERRFQKRQFREIDLRVYSNLGVDLEVTVNGKPITAKPEINSVRFIWADLQLPAGKAVVVVQGKFKGKIVRDEVAWDLPDLLPSGPKILIPGTEEPRKEGPNF